MKTTLIVMAALLLSAASYASENFRLSMYPAGKETAMVEINNKTATEVDIKITNDVGKLIFSKKVKEPAASYQRKYDFSDLEDGRYILYADSGNELNEKRFEMENGIITVTDERKVLKPVITGTENVWKLTYLNHPLESMNLYVYEGSRLLYHEKIEPVFAVHKGLNLAQLLPGNYQIIFANDYNAFEYNVEVK